MAETNSDTELQICNPIPITLSGWTKTGFTRTIAMLLYEFFDDFD